MSVYEYIKSIILSTLLLGIILPSPSSIEASENTSQGLFNEKVLNLSIQEGILMVLKKNLDISIQQIEPQVKTEKIVREKGIFDPLISSSFQMGDSTTPLSTRPSVAAGGRTIVESETYAVNAGISGKIPLGTEYSIEFEDILTKNSFNEFQSEYETFAGIRITQPLLKDFGYDTNRLSIHIAQKDRNISISELKQQIIDIVSEFKKAYWNMVLAIDELRVREESLKLAESLLDLTRKRLKAEVVSPLELTQAEAGMASRKEDVLIARQIVKERENTLKRLISNDIYEMKNVEIVPIDIPTVVPVTFDFEKCFREGIENRPDYRMIKTEIEKNNIIIRYNKNQKFPNVDLEASYGFNGLSDKFGDSLTDMSDNPQWTLGIVLKFPIGNRTAEGDLRIAQLEAEQKLLSLKRLEQEILVEIDNAIKELETNKQRIEATKVSKRLAEESLRAEELKLREGLSTSHNVLEFQEELVKAKSREIIAIVDYNKSLVELSRLKGTILEEENITFSEYTNAMVRR